MHADSNGHTRIVTYAPLSFVVLRGLSAFSHSKETCTTQLSVLSTHRGTRRHPPYHLPATVPMGDRGAPLPVAPGSSPAASARTGTGPRGATSDSSKRKCKSCGGKGHWRRTKAHRTTNYADTGAKARAGAAAEKHDLKGRKQYGEYRTRA